MFVGEGSVLKERRRGRKQKWGQDGIPFLSLWGSEREIKKGRNVTPPKRGTSLLSSLDTSTKRHDKYWGFYLEHIKDFCIKSIWICSDKLDFSWLFLGCDVSRLWQIFSTSLKISFSFKETLKNFWALMEKKEIEKEKFGQLMYPKQTFFFFFGEAKVKNEAFRIFLFALFLEVKTSWRKMIIYAETQMPKKRIYLQKMCLRNFTLHIRNVRKVCLKCKSSFDNALNISSRGNMYFSSSSFASFLKEEILLSPQWTRIFRHLMNDTKVYYTETIHLKTKLIISSSKSTFTNMPPKHEMLSAKLSDRNMSELQ